MTSFALKVVSGSISRTNHFSQAFKLDCNAAGDVNSIKVGENSNIQDNVVVHVAKHNAQDRALPTIIGNNVTIGALNPYEGLVPSEPAHLQVCLLQAWQ